MGEKKILDLVKAAEDETTDLVLSEVLPEVVKTYGEIVVPEVIANLAGDLLGAVLPRFNSIRLSYKQNRLERNVSIMLDSLVSKQEILSKRIDELQKTIEGKNFIQQLSEMLLDNIVDEIQPLKVNYNVNGYLNLLETENANLDISLMFFKTLADLNEIDIRVLQNYDCRHPGTSNPITPFNSKLDSDQLRYIKEKLIRFGLLRSQNKEKREKNLELIIEFLKDFYKDYTSKKPKGVKFPKIKKLQSIDGYNITPLGFALLQLISDKCDLIELSVADYEEDEDDK